MSRDDELESAKKYTDVGQVILTDHELQHLEVPAGLSAEQAVMRLLHGKGLPCCGSRYPAIHPDFLVSTLYDPANKRTAYRWQRRALLTLEPLADPDKLDPVRRAQYDYRGGGGQDQNPYDPSTHPEQRQAYAWEMHRLWGESFKSEQHAGRNQPEAHIDASEPNPHAGRAPF